MVRGEEQITKFAENISHDNYSAAGYKSSLQAAYSGLLNYKHHYWYYILKERCRHE